MPTRRLGTSLSLFVCFAAILVCGQPASASLPKSSFQPGSLRTAPFHTGYVSAKEKADLARLRQQAAAARQELERGTKKWEEGRKTLHRAQKRLLQTEKKLAKAERRLDQLRGPVAAIANAAYQSPTASNATTLIAVERPQAALRTAADLQKIQSSRSALVREAAQTRARLLQLAKDANDLRKATTAEADRLARFMHQLQRESAAATEDLTRALRKIGVRPALDRAPTGCDPERARRAGQYPNGLIPSWAMCALPQSGHFLRADAAIAFYRLNAAYAARFGEALCVTSAYRSLGEQQRIYARQPGMAAVPGSSLHGVGLAVDFCGGVQQFGSVQYSWMVANAERFGWYHPAWAMGSQFEPWHWEYDADSGVSLS